MPDPQKAPRAVEGYSETRGIEGGVEDAFLAAQSEAIERALGDALTLSLVQVLEVKPDVVLIKGPCFPKTLGRILSLRSPEQPLIAWLTATRRNGESVADGETSPIRSLTWDQDDLVNSFSHPSSEPRWLIEFIDRGDRILNVNALTSILDARPLSIPKQMDFSERLLAMPANSTRFLLDSVTPEIPKWLVNCVDPLVKKERVLAKGPLVFEWRDELI